jgi:hypothetical protein
MCVYYIMSPKCPKGMIRRKSYSRKSSKTNKRVVVKSSCVKDMGAVGKTPKAKRVLPALGDEIHLSKYGYTTSDNKEKREQSLRRASRKHGTLPILRRLNLIRNYQADEKAKRVMSRDVKYMSRLHSKKKSSK